MGTGCTVSCHVRQQTLGGPEGGRAAADPARPGHSSAPIGVETCCPGVGSAVWRGLEKPGRLFSLCRAETFAYPERGTPVGELDRRSCLYHIPPQTAGKVCFSRCLENPSGSSDSGCYRCPQLPKQEERWALLLRPHLRSCLLLSQGQVGEICSLIFSSVNSAVHKCSWEQQDPSPAHTRAPLQRIPVPHRSRR